MFGEKPIVGQTILRISKDDRITIPSFTGIEPGEEISSMIDPYYEKLILLREKEMIERLKAYMEKIDAYRASHGMSYKEYDRMRLYIWAILPQADKKVNQQSQFLLYSKRRENMYDVKELRKLEFKDQIFAVGVGHTLELYKSEEAYHLSLTKKEERQTRRQQNV